MKHVAFIASIYLTFSGVIAMGAAMVPHLPRSHERVFFTGLACWILGALLLRKVWREL